MSKPNRQFGQRSTVVKYLLKKYIDSSYKFIKKIILQYIDFRFVKVNVSFHILIIYILFFMLSCTTVQHSQRKNVGTERTYFACFSCAMCDYFAMLFRTSQWAFCYSVVLRVRLNNGHLRQKPRAQQPSKYECHALFPNFVSVCHFMFDTFLFTVSQTAICEFPIAFLKALTEALQLYYCVFFIILI